MLIDIKDKSIDEQGERMVPSYHKGFLVYGEHIARYESVLPLLKDKVVLDIASGSGYGSYIMADAAKKVMGVDIDKQAVIYAKKNYSRPNIDFREGSGENIPLEDSSVDIVVTFETIEHIKNYNKFMVEIKRVLKPNGIAVISTPNDVEFPEGNHFHLHEFTLSELKVLTNKYFKHTKFNYQYTWIYTAVFHETPVDRDWRKEIETLNTVNLNKDKAIYYTALCSDVNIPSVTLKEIAVISQHWSERQKQQIENENNSVREKLRLSNALYTKSQLELNSIYNSKGWHFLTRIYRIKSRLKGLRN